MTLTILATEENWQAFDDAWTSLIASGGEIDELCRAIEVIGSKRRISRCLHSALSWSHMVFRHESSVERRVG